VTAWHEAYGKQTQEVTVSGTKTQPLNFKCAKVTQSVFFDEKRGSTQKGAQAGGAAPLTGPIRRPGRAV
jgi:hypothetical protein